MKKSVKVMIDQVLSEGDLLAQQQADFYENYIVKANDVLYGLLADLMRYSDQVLRVRQRIAIFISRERLLLCLIWVQEKVHQRLLFRE